MDEGLRTILWIFYLMFWHVYSFCQKLFRKLFDEDIANIPWGQIRVSRILFRFNRDVDEVSRAEDFITTHESFESFDILKDSHWVLYTFDEVYAYFVHLPQEASHYDIINYPFCFIPFFEQAQKVAQMPICDFISWTKRLEMYEKPKETVFFTSPPRSASTLFGAMLHHKGRSVTFGEPYALAQLSGGFSEGYWNEEELKELVPAAVRAIRKNVPINQICVIKTSSREIQLVPFLKSMPEVKHIFLWRKNGMDSIERVIYRSLGEYADTIAPIYLKIYQSARDAFNFFMGLLLFGDGWIFRLLKPQDVKEAAFCTYIAPYISYLKCSKQFCHPIVLHEDLIKNPEIVLKSVFQQISLPDESIPEALERLDFDSQEGTFLSWENMKKFKSKPCDEKQMFRLKQMTEFLGVSGDKLVKIS